MTRAPLTRWRQPTGRERPAHGTPQQPLTARPTTVQATRVLAKGQSIQNEKARLVMQADGDLVILDELGAVRWRSNTAGRGDRAIFQADGHFVVYDVGNRNVWSSGTAGNDGAVLVLTADGDVRIVTAGGSVIWSGGGAH
jgi:hypothetical protein